MSGLFPRKINILNNYSLILIGMWLLLVGVTLKLRPLLPVDETRYLSVAWDMWQNDNFLVPHLNGAPYSHKPPLLFWFMHLGWSIFGVNDWWPRLVAPFFGLVNLFLVNRLAQDLWPNKIETCKIAPLILLSCLFWTLFTTLTMFDMLLAFCALISMIGIIRAWENNNPSSFSLLAIGIGMGLLAKGPAILLSTLPVGLLAPLWALKTNSNRNLKNFSSNNGSISNIKSWSQGWKFWYLCIFISSMVGILIALTWAIPAAFYGGEEYRNSIFWGQSAGRMLNSFAHSRPWWWFLAVLPGLLLPWTIWPAIWKAIFKLRELRHDVGILFCLFWFLPALLIFSIISGKQLHYLLPVFPALALISARLIVDYFEICSNQKAYFEFSLFLPATFFFITGFGFGCAPLITQVFNLKPTVMEFDFIWGLVFALLAVFIFQQGQTLSSLMSRIICMVVLSLFSIFTVHLGLKTFLDERFDMENFSRQAQEWQNANIPLAYLGKYHGQFNFLGRLKKPIPSVGLKHPDLENWQKRNPDGYIIVNVVKKHEQIRPIYSQKFRSRRFIVITVAQSLSHPEIISKP